MKQNNEQLTKVQLANKYGWEDWHSDECECLYCVMMEMFSREHELRRTCSEEAICQTDGLSGHI